LFRYIIFTAVILNLLCFSALSTFMERTIDEYFSSAGGGNYTEDNAHNAVLTVIGSGRSERDYYYLLPPTYNENTPVVVALHGSQRSGLSMIDTWSTIARTYSVIIIAPNAVKGDWDFSDSDFKFIKAAFKDVAKKLKLRTKIPLLFGHSSGGVFALKLAVERPELFPVVAVHAAAVPKNLRLSRKDKGSYRYSRVAMYVGDRDAIFPMEMTRQTAKKLSSFGLDIRLYFLKDHGHWYYSDHDQINGYIWTFYNGY
jgi:poly(3-hydroxybutyrate) depolymerase